MTSITDINCSQNLLTRTKNKTKQNQETKPRKCILAEVDRQESIGYFEAHENTRGQQEKWNHDLRTEHK